MSRTLDAIMLQKWGLSQAESDRLLPLIETCLEAPDPEKAWQLLTNQVLRPDVPFALHQYLYAELSKRRSREAGPLPVWYPGERHIAEANATQFAKKLDLEDFAALHRWSVNNRYPFWRLVIEALGISFSQEPKAIAKETIHWGQPAWLPDAKLNIADSCFLADSEETAILWQPQEDAPLQKISYGALWQWSGRIAHSLRSLGYREGDALAIDMVMNPESVAIYLGILRAGCVVISIADSFSAAEIRTRLRIGEAKGIFTMDVIRRGQKLLPMYEKVCAARAPRAIVLPCGESLCKPLRDGDLAWEDFLGADCLEESIVCESRDLVNILFSSGTTGDPKAIVWDHTTPIKAAMDGYLHHDIHAGEVVAWPTNLGWMMGPWLIFATLVNRATIALYGDAPTGVGFCKFVEKAGVNLLGVVPSLVKAWRQADAIAGLDWTQIRAFSSTGECSNADDMHYLMAQAGYRPVLEYCGGTEIGGGYFCGSMVQPAVPAAFSTPVLGLDFVILDEANRHADVGELFLVPPSIGLSSDLLNRNHQDVYYWGVPKVEPHQKLRRHGDQFQRLPGGYYRAEGRADDTMNLGGIKVGSAELERVLKLLPQVKDVAAVAIPPEGGGPGQLVIFAVFDERSVTGDLRAEMQRVIRTKLNPLFKIHDLRQVGALPRTASGKVMRRVLRAKYPN